MKVLKEVKVNNFTIVFVEQSAKATEKDIDNLHNTIANLLTNEAKKPL